MSNDLEKKAVQLTDDEVEKAAGGANDDTKTWKLKCSACGHEFTTEIDTLPTCPNCGKNHGQARYTVIKNFI